MPERVDLPVWLRVRLTGVDNAGAGRNRLG